MFRQRKLLVNVILCLGVLEGDVEHITRWIAKAVRGVHTFYLKVEEMQRNDMFGEKWGYN